MLHFTVLVVTPDLNPGTLEAALQPFHEYECTGTEDQYMVDVDMTAEARETFAKETTDCVRGPDGKLHSFFTPEGNWDARFSQPVKNPDRWDTGRRERYIPPGYEQVTVPTSDLEDFTAWATSYYGSEARGEGEHIQIIKRTNPNKQWDWWQVGGRWTGLLQLKPGTVGRRGQRSLLDQSLEKPGIDQCRKGDLDIEAMRFEAIGRRKTEVRKAYDTVSEASHKLTGDTLADSQITALWVEFTTLHTRLMAEWEAAEHPRPRFFEWAQAQDPRFAQLVAMRVTEIGTFGFDVANVPTSEPDPFAWADRAPALQTFAFLGLDGVWRERGDMGWFGMVSDEKDPGAWETEYTRALAEVPDDAFISIVDCHI